MSLERYSRATRSTNLKSSDYAELDVDWLTAAGMAQINGDPLPPMVARLLSGDSTAFWGVVEALEKRYFTARRTDSLQARRQIQDALWWFLTPACRDCVKGYRKIPDTNRLDEQPCPSCEGSGLSPHPHNGPSYAETLKVLDQAASDCISVIRKKVA